MDKNIRNGPGRARFPPPGEKRIDKTRFSAGVDIVYLGINLTSFFLFFKSNLAVIAESNVVVHSLSFSSLNIRVKEKIEGKIRQISCLMHYQLLVN